jgi:hypothetical protein
MIGISLKAPAKLQRGVFEIDGLQSKQRKSILTGRRGERFFPDRLVIAAHAPETEAAAETARPPFLHQSTIEVSLVSKCRTDLSGISLYFIVFIVVISEGKLTAACPSLGITPSTLELKTGAARRQEDYFRILFS